VPAIHQLVPDPQALLALEVPEAALVLLQHLADVNSDGASPSRPVHIGNFFNECLNPANGYIESDPKAAQYKARITEHLIAAWLWLRREGLLLPAPGNTQGWEYVGRRGREATSRESFQRYRRAGLLPREILHPSIAASVFSAFLRGEYDIAIFAAFRGVEDAVRQAAGLPHDLVGVPLMRKAFDVNSGPLTNSELVPAEKQAMSDVYAGAMGLFKNPTGHRINAFDTPEEAVSLILFANHLINGVNKIVGEKGKNP
jgi:uncharacterized protein (TIGR02391 family)